MNSHSKPTVCIVSHFAWGALTGGRHGRCGGVEWQTSLTARWLAAQGYRVSLLTWDYGQGETAVDGVQVIPLCREQDGLPVLRFLHPRWTSLVRALRRADADVYYHNCAEYITGQIALWCRRNNRPFVYSVASDPDCDVRLAHMPSMRERSLYRYGLRHADRVIVQTRKQQTMLRNGYGIEAHVIPMPCPGATDGQYVEPAAPSPGAARIAWVGRVTAVKRLEFLLDVAQAMPESAFDVVGDSEDATEYVGGLYRRARALPNVVLHGRVPRDRLPEIYKRASCLCCTSTYEGFPNTFLEAWSHGLPVVSTVDPDDLIASQGLGGTAGDPKQMADVLRKLLRCPQDWQQASRRARQYYLANHTLEGVMPQFERAFQEVLGR